MAGIAQHFIEFLKPVHIAMAGFCAGKKDDVVLGDVIVSSTVYRYGVGKQLSEHELLPEIHAFNLDFRWKQKAERFGDEWMYIPTEKISHHGQFDHQLR